MRYGLDLLGAAMFPALAVRSFPEGWSLGVFANAFGDGLPVVKRLFASGKCTHARVQLLWSDDNHKFTQADLPKMREEAERCERLKRAFPNCTLEISPFCEHNLQDPDKWLKIAEQAAPSCVVVNSPYKGALSRRYKNETHGPNSGPRAGHNYSYDGTSAVDSDVVAMLEKHARADTFYFWIPQFNGRRHTTWHDDDPERDLPREKRTNWPTKELIEGVVYLANSRGKVQLEKGWTYKSHSDDQNPDHPRELKGLLIAPPRFDRVELVTRTGEVVARASDPEPYADGRFRYYFNQYGYKLAEKIKQITSQRNGIAMLRCDGKVRGQVNPAFRAGDFRN